MEQVPQTPIANAPETMPEEERRGEMEETRSVDAQVRDILTATSPGK